MFRPSEVVQSNKEYTEEDVTDQIKNGGSLSSEVALFSNALLDMKSAKVLDTVRVLKMKSAKVLVFFFFSFMFH